MELSENTFFNTEYPCLSITTTGQSHIALLPFEEPV
jgi:hypothetical protein